MNWLVRWIKIKIALSNTLQQLKDVLGQKNHFGPLSGSTLRLFHMGRELKSGGRSLSVLGIGRHNNNVLHMHVTGTVSSSSETTTTVTKRSRPSASTTSTTPAAGTHNNSTDSQNNNSVVAPTGGRNLKTDPVIDLMSDSEDEDALEVAESAAARSGSGSGSKRRRG